MRVILLIMIIFAVLSSLTACIRQYALTSNMKATQGDESNDNTLILLEPTRKDEDPFHEFLKESGLLSFYEFRGYKNNGELELFFKPRHFRLHSESESILLDSFVKLLFKYSNISHIPLEKASISISDRNMNNYNVKFKSGQIEISSFNVSECLVSCIVSTVEIKDERLFNEYIHIVNNTIALPGHEEIPQPYLKMSNLIAVIDNYYKDKGNLEIFKQDSTYAQFTVSKLTNEIIKGENLWEKIQGIIIVNFQESVLKIHLILDGQYASGLGTPKAYDYYDMEPKYTTCLQRYTDLVLNMMKTSLEVKHDKRK